MKLLLLLLLLILLISDTNTIVHEKNPSTRTTNDQQILAKAKIYSDLAEIIQPLHELPLEFSVEDWSNIRSDSLTLIGSNVNVMQQTITEKKNSLNNQIIYVRSPLSSQTETKFLQATMIDENRNLVKLIDNNISQEPIFFTVSSDQILYINEPPQSKYYVNFTYYTTDTVYVSYLCSNLKWKTRYQLYLFDESKEPILIAMADIRNDGKASIDIEYAELLAGDINLQMSEQPSSWIQNDFYRTSTAGYGSQPPSTMVQGQEVAGLYVYTINQPFSIDSKTNFLLPMFRPQVNVTRFVRIYKTYFYGVRKSIGKGERTYRLSSDVFLPRGNCMIREYNYLVGETFLPDIASKNTHEFSIGQDPDIFYNETVTLVSSRIDNETLQASNTIEQRIQSIYNVTVLFKNFKNNRSINMEYKQIIQGRSVQLLTSNSGCIRDGTIVECKTTLSANEEKLLFYTVEIIN
ncbi:unnamed protein product [Rotaria sp. Silwood2]|nr:unnamed protein product [Rotaria sp. Silwood2]CAF4281125.1 unnamed protein product [Rotaria sp. Silwood2]CAF4296026.1 unnamed protein product [Rotaria sp. Silwood2]